jgi:LPXTG-motif cell wall-anchored protein
VTVYAKDSFENTGASETIWFSVADPFPTTLVAVVSGASVAIIGIGLLVYFKKRNH